MAKEAWPFLIPIGICSVVCLILFRYVGHPWGGYLGGALLIAAGFIAFFFRDPKRHSPMGEGLVLASGDGKVLAVQPVAGDPWLEGDGVLVSVFLTIFNVHVNRIPISGRVDTVVQHPGKFRLAFSSRASSENEQTIVRIQAPTCKVVVKQIAGFIARRIVCRLAKGDTVRAGQRFGLIKFGSRIDHLLPSTAEVKVEVGDWVKAGETVIGVIPK